MGAHLRTHCRYCGKIYTPEEQAERIAKKQQNARDNIKKAIANGNFPGRKPKYATPEGILELRESGIGLRALAKQFNVSTTTIVRWLKGSKK